jgi:microcystin-dependent protein
MPIAGGTFTGAIDVTGTVTADYLNITAADNAITAKLANTDGANYLQVTNGTANGYFGTTATDTVTMMSIGAHPITFGTDGGAERMRIDASGNVLVGTTSNDASTTSSNAGVNVRAVGQIATATDGTVGAIFNRMSSDGDIALFRKDGSTVGSIGTVGGGTYVGTGDTGLFFEPATNQIRPFNTSTVNSIDATIDLGRTSTRFKDAHFSGTVNANSFSGDGSGLTGIAGTPAGAVIYHAANTAPTGFIKANGASISTSTYSDLFAVIGYTFGGSGGSFNVPDLRGEFLRGWDDGRGVDSGRGFGSSQGGAMQQHRHTINSGGGGGGIAILVTQTNRVAGLSGGGALQDAPSTLGSVSGGATTATETRPRNIALLACIKY